jgi:translation initiation factor IF-3
MTETAMKGVLSIAPNAVCEEDRAIVDEVRARNVELANRNGKKDGIIKAARALLQSNEDPDLVLLLGILSQ